MEFMNVFVLMSAAASKSGIEGIIEGNGINLTILGMSVVFSGLIVMALVLNFLEGAVKGVKKLFTSLSSSLNKKEEEGEVKGSPSESEHSASSSMTAEEVVAICTALVLHHRMYLDTQKEILTWKGKGRLNTLTPWTLEGRIHRTPPRVKR